MEYTEKQNSQKEENGGPEKKKKLMKPWENTHAPPSLLVKNQLLKSFHLAVELSLL